MRVKLFVAAAAVLLAVVAVLYLLPAGGERPIVVGTLHGGISTLDVLEAGLVEGPKIEVVYFDRTLDLAQALASGDLDVAVIPVEFVARLRERGAPVVIAAVDMFQNQMVVGRGVRSLEDLVGRRVGVFTPTGTFAMFKSYMASVLGVNVERDLILVDKPPAQLLQSLETGEVDAVVLWEPLATKALRSGDEITSFSELWRQWSGLDTPPPMVAYAAYEGFASDRPSDLEALLEARKKAAELWEETPGELLELLADKYGLTETEVADMLDRVRVWPGDLTEEVVEGILRVWELAREGGYLTEDPELLAEGAFWRP